MEEKRRPNKSLRYERELRGWSQRYVAGRIGTTEQVVTRWESGQHKPNRYFQTQLCELFGKSAEELGFMSSEQENFPLLTGSLTDTIYEKGGINLDELRRIILKSAVGLTAGAFIQPLDISDTNKVISHCWQMYYSDGPLFIEPFLQAFLFQIKPLSHHPEYSSTVSQVYQLLADIAIDQENYGSALKFREQALLYARESGDHNLEVTALIRLANMYFHRKQTLYSLRSYQQALPLLKEASPLLRGRVYVGLAEVLAMRGEREDALKYMGLAYESYPEHPEQDPTYYYTHFSRYDLYVFGDSQTRLFLDQPKEAQKSLSVARRELPSLNTELRSQVDLLYYQLSSSVKLGSLEEGSIYLQAALTRAKKANSWLYYNKILAVYQEMQQKWPREKSVQELDELFQLW